MKIDINLNVGMFTLLGVIGVLGYGVCKQTVRVNKLTKELKMLKGETKM